jgi:hypothetical protein
MGESKKMTMQRQSTTNIEENKMSNGQHIYTTRSTAASTNNNKRLQKRRIISNSAAGITTLPLPPSRLEQRIQRNSKSTAYILTTFLFLSFCFQFVLVSYHNNDDYNEVVVLQNMITSVKDEIVTDLDILDEEMVDMLNAVYEYNIHNNYYFGDDDEHHGNNKNAAVDGIVSEIIEQLSTTSIQYFCGKCRYKDQDFNCNNRIQWVMKNKHKTEEEAKLAELKYCLEKETHGSGSNNAAGGGKKGAALLHSGKWVKQDKPNDSSSSTNNQAAKAPFKLLDKSNWDQYSMEPLQILQRAGVDHTEGFIPSMTFRQARQALKQDIQIEKQEAQLPSLSEIQSLYGTKPYIVGLDRCQAYRDAVDPEFRLIGAAGLFNSATNLLGQLLRMNCINNARLQTKKYNRLKDAPTGVKMQAPWGKHNPVFWRLHHEAKLGGAGINQEEFLPIVMIKDPLTWMASMCRHSYEARWRHTLDHCPNLVANELDKGKKIGENIPVFVKFATKHIGDEPLPDPKNRTFIKYDSLVELWNRWYTEWTAAEFPRLMVRFEDLLFHAEETISQICDCAGGKMRPRFRYVEDSAKGDSGPHAGSAGFLASLVTYGNSTKRMKDILTDEADYEYAKENLDEKLMKDFGYAPL